MCVSVCYVYMYVAFTSSLSGRESVGEYIGKRVLAKIEEYSCQLNVEACPGFFM